MPRPAVSYIIVSHRRRDRLLATLDRLAHQTPHPAGGHEVWVVDNASADGSAAAVRERHPGVHLIELTENRGVGARSLAMARARGDHQVLLDDDSYPLGDAVARSIAHLDAEPACGAVVGACTLPDGRQEACALPNVLISCAVCLRGEAVRRVGGFDDTFFRKGGEYDYSFRLWQAGYRIDRFEDLHYRHDKVLTGRSAAFATRMDLRNNLLLVERFLPRAARTAYRADWMRRYAGLAAHAGHQDAARDAVSEARTMAAAERTAGRAVLSPSAFEAAFGWRQQADAVTRWAADELPQGPRRVALGGLGKNIYATWRACGQAGLHVAAVVDPAPAFAGLRYRGVPVVPGVHAVPGACDGVVVADVNPATAPGRAARLRGQTDRPVLTLWQPRTLGPATTGSAPRSTPRPAAAAAFPGAAAS